MGFRIFKNMIKQGFQGMWRNRGMSLASVGSITAVLIILGIVLIIVLSINNIVLETRHKFDEIQIFLEDDITETQIDNIGKQIENSDGVLSLSFQTKEEALETMKKDWGDRGYLLEGLEEENPLPSSYVVKLDDIEHADNVVKKVENLKGVEEIKYYRDIINKLVKTTNYVRIGGIIIIGILLLISVFIISNTIKITVTARKREINIMKYVGATNGYIRGPFIIEGILLGIVGSIISVIIVNYGYQYFFKHISEKLYVLFTLYLVPPSALVIDIIIIFTAIGIGIGILGSLVSLKRFLNV